MNAYLVGVKQINEKTMEITEKQTISLLRMMQRFQVAVGGKYKVAINTYNVKNVLWFTCDAILGNKLISGRCYEWDTYENNKKSLIDFMKKLS